jgi:hypothetical protein
MLMTIAQPQGIVILQIHLGDESSRRVACQNRQAGQLLNRFCNALNEIGKSGPVLFPLSFTIAVSSHVDVVRRDAMLSELFEKMHTAIRSCTERSVYKNELHWTLFIGRMLEADP